MGRLRLEPRNTRNSRKGGPTGVIPVFAARERPGPPAPDGGGWRGAAILPGLGSRAEMSRMLDSTTRFFEVFFNEIIASESARATFDGAPGLDLGADRLGWMPRIERIGASCARVRAHARGRVPGVGHGGSSRPEVGASGRNRPTARELARPATDAQARRGSAGWRLAQAGGRVKNKLGTFDVTRCGLQRDRGLQMAHCRPSSHPLAGLERRIVPDPKRKLTDPHATLLYAIGLKPHRIRRPIRRTFRAEAQRAWATATAAPRSSGGEAPVASPGQLADADCRQVDQMSAPKLAFGSNGRSASSCARSMLTASCWDRYTFPVRTCRK